MGGEKQIKFTAFSDSARDGLCHHKNRPVSVNEGAGWNLTQREKRGPIKPLF